MLLSEYIQEIGRGGRDGKRAEALALVSEPTGWLNPEDKQRQRFFIERTRSQRLEAQQLIEKIPSQGEITEVVRKFPNAGIALSLLHSQGQLKWLDPFHYAILSHKNKPQKKQSHPAQQMYKYLHTKQCRWQFLLNAFGFGSQGENWRCGHCDRCKI